MTDKNRDDPPKGILGSFQERKGIDDAYYAGLPGGAEPPPPPITEDVLVPSAFDSDAMLPWIAGPPGGETDFYRIDTRLQGLQTRIVYVGVPDPDLGGDRSWWDLHGNYGGAQGLMTAESFGGLMHAPFNLKLQTGAYQLGATWQRTDWEVKQMTLGAMVGVGVGPVNSFDYRKLEQRWWASWSTDEDGYLGIFTRTHGWRWIPVRLADSTRTVFEIDPTANDNNFMQWDMNICALYPFFSKKTIMQTWTNPASTSTDWDLILDLIDRLLKALLADLGPAAAGSSQILADVLPQKYVGVNTFAIANKGTWPAYPKYIVSAPGIAWIQNGWNADGSPQMLQLPLLTEKDGYVLVDTDPDARTLTATTDPIDPLFMQILRNSSLVEILLGPLINSTKPIWQELKFSFTEAAKIPPRTVANLTAWHSQNGGTITCIMPQTYKMAWG